MQPNHEQQRQNRHRPTRRAPLRGEPTRFDWLVTLAVAAVLIRLWIAEHLVAAIRIAIDAVPLAALAVLVAATAALVLWLCADGRPFPVTGTES